MKKLLISLLAFAAVTANARSLRPANLVADLEVIRLEGFLKTKNIVGASVTLDRAQGEVHLTVAEKSNCPPGAMCIVGPLFYEYSAEIVSTEKDSCGSTIIHALTDNRRVDGSRTEIVVKDHTTMICEIIPLHMTNVTLKIQGPRSNEAEENTFGGDKLKPEMRALPTGVPTIPVPHVELPQLRSTLKVEKLDENGSLQTKNIVSGEVTVSEVGTITVELYGKRTCPPGAYCATVVGPRRFEFIAEVENTFSDFCNVKTYQAYTDRRPVDGSMTAITVRDYSQVTCKNLRPVAPTQVELKLQGPFASQPEINTFSGTQLRREGVHKLPVVAPLAQ